MTFHRWALTVAVVAVGLAVPPTAAAAPTTIRVSLTDADAQGNGRSGAGNVVVSADGRYILFASNAALVPGDTNHLPDVYLRDVVTGTTTRVSVTSHGGQLDGDSLAPVAISPGGRWIVYVSCAQALGIFDCYQGVLFDRDTGHTRVVGVGLTAAHVAISSGGRFIAADNGAFDRGSVYRYNVDTGRSTDVGGGVPGASGDDGTLLAGMSDSGRFVLFSHFFGFNETRRARAFVRDMALHRTRPVAGAPTGPTAPSAFPNAISGDGQARMFTTADGTVVPTDTNGTTDVFVSMRGGRVRRVSVSSSGHQANRSSRGLALSGTGRFSLFWSEATNLVPGDTNHRPDLFVHDARTGRTFRVDLNAAGSQILRPKVFQGTISADGAWVVWASRSHGVVPGDTNGVPDVFARGPLR